MTISDRIQLISIISSAIIGLVSIIIATQSLLQNKKMIRESTRPYIVVYLDRIYSASGLKYYFVIKNFGSSGATITKFKTNFDLRLLEGSTGLGVVPFGNLQGSFIAPSQSFYTTMFKMDFEKLSEKLTNISFEISYKDSIGTFSDSFCINLTLHDNLIVGKTSIRNSEHAL